MPARKAETVMALAWKSANWMIKPYSILRRTHSVSNGRAVHVISRSLVCFYGCSTTMARRFRIYSALIDMVTGAVAADYCDN